MLVELTREVATGNLGMPHRYCVVYLLVLAGVLFPLTVTLPLRRLLK